MKKIRIQLVNIKNGELFEEFLLPEKVWKEWLKKKGEKTWNDFIKELLNKK